MADTYDYQGLLNQFQPTQADRDAARKAQLQTFFLSLLGTQKGDEFRRLGAGGLLANAAYTNTLDNSQKAAMERMQAAGMAMKLREGAQQFQDLDEQRQALGATQFQQPASPMQSAMQQAPSLSPTTQNVASVQQAAAQTQRPGLYEQLLQRADAMDQWARDHKSVAVAKQAEAMREQAQKYAPQYDGTETLMQNGKPVVVQKYKNRDAQTLPNFQPKPDTTEMGTGQQKFLIDKLTGAQVGPGYQQVQTPDSQASVAASLLNARQANALGYAHLNETKRHNEIVEGDPATIEQTAQGIASGQLAPLSGYALGRPMGQAVMARVVQINPTYDAKQFATGQKAEKDFATGKQGNTVRSFNVALAHLDTLDGLATALDNKDMLLYNKVNNIFKQQTGQTAPTSFNAAKKVVGDEIVKAIVGSGGGVEDRAQASKAIDAANSPAQLKAVISTYKTLMVGQINGLRQQYQTSTGRNDFDRFLSPEAKANAHSGGGTDVRSQADRILEGK